MSTRVSIFKSPELEKQYFALYEEVLAMWPVTVDVLDMQTRFGKTHVNACGDRAYPPMILLPGFGANSTQWFPNVGPLSTKYRIYALDTPGQPGKSIPEVKLNVSNCAAWLDEVFNGLGLQKATLVGLSLGGWLALNLAIQAPERISHLVLLDPAASFEGMSAAFVWHSFLPFMVHPTRTGLTNYFRWMTRGYQVNKKWGELMLSGILNTLPQPPIQAKAFSDEELQKVKAPTLLLIGERSVIYNPNRVYQRATRLIPHITADIIPEASHSLNAEKADTVNERILRFCQAQTH
jgi:pimeloyl-ACP methyl ester carboxylesterase